MKYYLVEIEIQEGECEYADKYIISCETDPPDHANLELSVWNWGADWEWDDYSQMFDLGTRMVGDRLSVEIPASEIEIASKYLNRPIPFEFDKDFDPKAYDMEG